MFFDGECSRCRAAVKRFGAFFQRAGFRFVPLQEAIVSGRYELPAEEFYREMKLLTRDRCWLGGVEAFREMFRARAALVPVAGLLGLPGIHALAIRLYEWVAANRHCGNGTCGVGEPRRGRRRLIAAAWLPMFAGGVALPLVEPWVAMWALSFGLFGTAKLLTLLREPRAFRRGFRWRTLAYCGLTTTMTPAEVFDRVAVPPPDSLLRDMARAALNVCAGVVLVWGVVPHIENSMLRGWTGMIGLILCLHFGALAIVTGVWNLRGFAVTPLMRRPFRAVSLADLWDRRWNTAFGALARNLVFRPLQRRLGVRAAYMGVFLVSGLVHELVISVPARAGYGLPTLYFALQAAGILFCRTRFASALGLQRGAGGRAVAWLIALPAVVILFHPSFIRTVILPFLQTIQAP